MPTEVGFPRGRRLSLFCAGCWIPKRPVWDQLGHRGSGPRSQGRGGLPSPRNARKKQPCSWRWWLCLPCLRLALMGAAILVMLYLSAAVGEDDRLAGSLESVRALAARCLDLDNGRTRKSLLYDVAGIAI